MDINMISWEYEGLKNSYNLRGGLGVAVGFLARGLQNNGHHVNVEIPFGEWGYGYDKVVNNDEYIGIFSTFHKTHNPEESTGHHAYSILGPLLDYKSQDAEEKLVNSIEDLEALTNQIHS